MRLWEVQTLNLSVLKWFSRYFLFLYVDDVFNEYKRRNKIFLKFETNWYVGMFRVKKLLKNSWKFCKNNHVDRVMPLTVIILVVTLSIVLCDHWPNIWITLFLRRSKITSRNYLKKDRNFKNSYYIFFVASNWSDKFTVASKNWSFNLFRFQKNFGFLIVRRRLWK